MATPGRRRSRTGADGSDENIMALLDSSGVKQPRDLHDDRLSFLEAVRSSSLAAAAPSPPSWNMLNATFQILRDSRSLELAMASYHLLTDIDKCYPRSKDLGEVENSSSGVTDTVTVNEAWSPFNAGPETAYRDRDGRTRNTKELIDPPSFVTLVEDLKQFFTDVEHQLVIKVFSEPRWKLELVLQYFSKYHTKSVHTRRSTESPNHLTFEGILIQFSTPASTRNIIKKITPDVAQLLLAHAFQAYLSLQHDGKCVANVSDKIGSITLCMACKGLVSAFQNLRKADEDREITSFEQEALFTAEIILSGKA